jgi:hypothetical protein
MPSMAAAMTPSMEAAGVMSRSGVEEGVGASVPRRRRMQVAGRVGCSVPGNASVVNMTTVTGNVSVFAVSVSNFSTVRDKRMVVVCSPAMMPIASPVVKTPAKASKCSKPESQSKTNSWTVKVKSSPRRPPGKHRDWISVH